MFLRIDDAARARAALGEFIPQVITAEHWTDKPESGINVAFSFDGLRALGAAATARSTRSRRSSAPAWRRARTCSATSATARPTQWEEPFRDGARPRARDGQRQGPGARSPSASRRIRARSSAAAARRWSALQDGAALEGGREHFGYADGFAQPSIEGSGFADAPGRRRAVDGDGWRPTQARRAAARLPRRAGRDSRRRRRPTSFGVNGSYLVYRKLAPGRRGVPAARCARPPPRYPGGEELLAAKIVGRWRDGTPLDVSPDRPDPALAKDSTRNNAFDYADDPAGMALPDRRARAAR